MGAGYGTRLQRDLVQASPQYDHLIGVPKALLPLGGRDALITHWLELFGHHGLHDIYVVTNAASYDAFCDWAKRNNVPQERIVSDGTMTNETRLGAVPDIQFGIRHFQLEHHPVLVVGGDTLFLHDFSLDAFLKLYNEDQCVVTTYQVPDAQVHKFGIVETDDARVMTSFVEKPDPKDTPSRSACPCFYLFAPKAVPLIQDFIESCQGKPKEAVDATGKFLAYLYPRFKVTTFPISGRIDVGGLESYLEADQYFRRP